MEKGNCVGKSYKSAPPASQLRKVCLKWIRFSHRAFCGEWNFCRWGLATEENCPLILICLARATTDSHSCPAACNPVTDFPTKACQGNNLLPLDVHLLKTEIPCSQIWSGPVGQIVCFSSTQLSVGTEFSRRARASRGQSRGRADDHKSSLKSGREAHQFLDLVQRGPIMWSVACGNTPC